ncbi:unnamed protein product [Effrenium voratum]|uniref:Methyltransferase type 11 domain-containing protein n=1 Tax=Effrenium voratum TaxID=2562239 RepID=A0AA36MRA1_9DINO|nr:unnamed protein product [Effrenium voratum]
MVLEERALQLYTAPFGGQSLQAFKYGSLTPAWAWKEEDRASFDADRYYDSERTAGYTEHNRGSQETLARRTLQLCSVQTESTDQETLLAVDLGCGSGLSSKAGSQCHLAVIGVDLSSEMLRSDEWEAEKHLSPMSGERLRCDLAQPLPFRSQVFDLCYSVSAVHYLATASGAEQRIRALTGSLRRILVPEARPVALQAYLTRSSGAVEAFQAAARKDGWLCDLVVDQSHGRPAERDYLYLRKGGTELAPRCALYSHAKATCALALEAWAQRQKAPLVRLDGAHRAWLVREHDRFARRLLRLHKRVADGASLDHAAPPGTDAAALAQRLAGIEEMEEEARLSAVLSILHS